MGLTYADITLANAIEDGLATLGRMPRDEVKQVSLSILVDTGSYMLAINEVIKHQLDLFSIDTTDAELADGSIVVCDIVGPVRLQFENRHTLCRAIVLPGQSEPLLGAIPLEDMDVVIDLKANRLLVNPAHPYRAVTKLKHVVKRVDSIQKTA